MNNKTLTIETISELLEMPSDDEENDEATRAVLTQLRDCLTREMHPKVIQLHSTPNSGILALKSDGTIHQCTNSMTGQDWEPFTTP